MTSEIDLFGLIVPVLLLDAVIALFVQILLGRMLSALRLYRLFWHPALVDVSTYFLCLGAVVAVLHRVHP